MAFGKKSNEAVLEAKIELYKEQIEDLKKQNKALMETLIAVKSPDAYKEMKADEIALANFRSEDLEEAKKREIRHDVQRKWLEGIEAPTFNSFDDFEAWLRAKNPSMAEDVATKPLHLNSES